MVSCNPCSAQRYNRNRSLEGIEHRESAPVAAAKVTSDLTDELPEVKWVLGGTRLLVNDQWLIDPQVGSLASFPYSAFRDTDGGQEPMQLSFTPYRDRVLVGNAHKLRFGPVNGPPSREFQIPPWQGAADDEGGSITLVAWVSEQHILVQKMSRQRLDVTCILLDTLARRWMKTEKCLSATFHEIGPVEAGPSGWLALSAYAEGVASVSIVRYDPMIGQTDVEAPRLKPGPFAPITVYFASDASRAFIATPCRINNFRSECDDDITSRSPWSLYAWQLGTRNITLEDTGLPPEFALSFQANVMAWPEPGQVCVADRNKLSHPHCIQLPSR